MAAESAESLDPSARLESIARGLGEAAGTEVKLVRLDGMPTAAVDAVERYLADLSRELAIRRLDPGRYSVAADPFADDVLSTIDVILTVFSPFRRQVVDAATSARLSANETFGLTLELPVVARDAAVLFGDLLEQVAIHGVGAGLVTPPLAEIPTAFFMWFLGSVVRQLDGEATELTYTGPAMSLAGRPSAEAPHRGSQSVFVDALHDSRSFPLALDSPRFARRFVAERLEAWGLAEHAARSSLPVSELVTNVILHARTQAVVEVMSALGKTRVGVRDFSPDRPVLRPSDPTSPFGRGLRIVDQSVSRWGVEVVLSGKSVWFELDADSAERRPSHERTT